MPRYLFDPDGSDIIDLELKDVDEARRVASEIASRMLSAKTQTLWGGDPWRLVVADERGLVLFLLDVMVTSSSVLDASRARGRV